jgi:membrane protease YdiL (CAAX protease family)
MASKTGLLISLVVLLSFLFLWMNTSFVFGPFAPVAERVLNLYLLALALTLAALNVPLPIVETRGKDLFNFTIFFFFTVVVAGTIALTILPQALIASLEPVQLIAGFGLLYGFVRALIEEIVFRGLIQKTAINILGVFQGITVQALLFGVFHATVLFEQVFPKLGIAGVFGSGLVLAILGWIWGWMAYNKETIGIWGAAGSHTGWNAVMQGGREAVRALTGISV